MPYNPTYPPSDGADLIRWLADELLRINPDILVSQEYFSFSEISTEPDRPQIGQISFADGINWNPGAGQGLYEYTNIGWAKLGGGDGNVVPTSHGSLQDLLNDDHPQYLDEARGDARYHIKAYINAHFGDMGNPHNTNVDNLIDTTITAPADDDVLTYVGGQWINQAVNVVLDHGDLTSIGINTHDQIDLHLSSNNNPHSTTIDNLDDTIINTPLLNEVLMYDGTNWTNEILNVVLDHGDLTSIGINTHDQIDLHLSSITNPHSTSVLNLTDTTLTALATDDVLQWNGAAWVNIAPTSLTSFLSLIDTPNDYVGFEGDSVRVNAIGTGLEFIPDASTGALSALYRFDNSIVDVDPGTGRVAMNNTDPTLVTEIYISETDGNGVSRAGGLAAVDAEDVIVYADRNTSDFHSFQVVANGTDNGTYWTYGVIFLNTLGVLNNNEKITVELVLIPTKNFINLLDTPDDYATFANSAIRVTLGEDGLEFYDIDHTTDILNVGTKTHTEIDTHIGDAAIHGYQPLAIRVVTADTTLVLTDAGNMVAFNLTVTGGTLTIPLNSVVAFPIGTEVVVQHKGPVSPVRVAPAIGVTLESVWDKRELTARYSAVTLIKTEINTWAVIGDLM